MEMTIVEKVIIALIVAVVAALLGLPAHRCENTAQTMRMNSQWGWTTGCMIEPEPGKWVPLNNYRVL